MTLTDDYGITLGLDGEMVLKGRFDFSYLLPREPGDTECGLDSYEFSYGDGTVFAEIASICYDAHEAADKMVIGLWYADGSEGTFELFKG